MIYLMCFPINLPVITKRGHSSGIHRIALRVRSGAYLFIYLFHLYFIFLKIYLQVVRHKPRDTGFCLSLHQNLLYAFVDHFEQGH